MVANSLSGFPGESKHPRWRSGRSERRPELWLRAGRTPGAAAEKGANRSVAPRQSPGPPDGEKAKREAKVRLAHARLRLGISSPDGEPQGAFPPNNTARHRPSPAYFLTQSVSGAMAPPPMAGPGPRLALASRDDIPPAHHPPLPSLPRWRWSQRRS